MIWIIPHESFSTGCNLLALFAVDVIAADSLSFDPLVRMGKAANLFVAGLRPNAAASLKKMEELPAASPTESLLPGQVA